MKDNTQLVSGAVVFKIDNNKYSWFLVKKVKEGEWEIPKSNVRGGESSVRTAIRIMAELGGMRAKVLEEVGRAGGAINVNGKTVPQRYLYYLMAHKGGGEVVGYADYIWLEYAEAISKLSSKRDKMTMRLAKQVLREWEKRQKAKRMY